MINCKELINYRLLLIVAMWIIIFKIEHIFSNCDNMEKAYRDGWELSKILEDHKNELYNQHFVMRKTDPGFGFFNEEPLPDELIAPLAKTEALRVSEQTFNELYNNEGNLDERLEILSYYSNCLPEQLRCINSSMFCDATEKYRSFSGECNNLMNPKQGARFTQHNRLSKAYYFDAIHSLRRSYNSKNNLVSPRIASNLLSGIKRDPGKSYPKRVLNFLAIMFGKYISHDLAFRTNVQNEEGGPGIQCCALHYRDPLQPELSSPACLPITVPVTDRFYSRFNITCLNNIRSQTILPNDCYLQPSQQINMVSQYLDNSNIYGSDETTARTLRKFKKGLLKSNKKNVLSENSKCKRGPCYISGDSRVNMTPMLALLHSIFHRLHNNIAKKLSEINKNWKDEQLYNETRRIVNAIYQNVIYEEWLPAIMGHEYCQKSELSCGKDSIYCGQYNPTIDSTTLNDFSHGIFRLFHSYVPSKVNLYNKENYIRKQFDLSNIFSKPKMLDQYYDDILRGLLYDSMNLGPYSDQLRNYLFKGCNPNGLDLLSIDIYTGRDHGIGPYHVYYELCVGSKIEKWEDLIEVLSIENVKQLQYAYNSVFDVDLLVGALMEIRYDEILGPVGKCIMREQFRRSKYGDRFFYSFKYGPHPFDYVQLREIYRYSFAKILCDTSKIRELPKNAFGVVSPENPIIRCDQLKGMNLMPWKEF